MSLFARLNTQIISLDFPEASIYVHCNPLGHILCLHAKNRLTEMSWNSNPSTCMCVQGSALHGNICILWS